MAEGVFKRALASTLTFLTAVFDLIPVLRPSFAPNHWPSASLTYFFRKVFFFHPTGHQGTISPSTSKVAE